MNDNNTEIVLVYNQYDPSGFASFVTKKQKLIWGREIEEYKAKANPPSKLTQATQGLVSQQITEFIMEKKKKNYKELNYNYFNR